MLCGVDIEPRWYALLRVGTLKDFSWNVWLTHDFDITTAQGSWKLEEKKQTAQSSYSLLCSSVVPGVTDCQRNEAGLQCDQDGLYQASQRDRESGTAFCVDSEGQRLQWSQTEAGLSDSQCLRMYWLCIHCGCWD